MDIWTKRKTRKPEVKSTMISLRDVVMDTRNLLIQFNNKQEEFNKMVFDQFEKHKWIK